MKAGQRQRGQGHSVNALTMPETVTENLGTSLPTFHYLSHCAVNMSNMKNKVKFDHILDCLYAVRLEIGPLQLFT